MMKVYFAVSVFAFCCSITSAQNQYNGGNSESQLSKHVGQNIKDRLLRKPKINGYEPLLPINFDDETRSLILKGTPMINVVNNLIEKREIPLPSEINPEQLVIKDITSETIGRARQSIILIGIKLNSEPKVEPQPIKWLYVFKETSDSKELKGIHNAYQMMRKTVLSHNGYTLKFAWHEKLWQLPSDRGMRFFELLHAAKGTTIEQIVKNFYDSNNLTFDLDEIAFNRKTRQFIENGYEGLRKEFISLRREAKKINPAISDLSEYADFIKYYSNNVPITHEEIKLKEFVDNYIVIRKTAESACKFLPDGSLDYNFAAVKEVAETYFAFGCVLGKYVKPYQTTAHPVELEKLFNMPALDPHPNNIFYDAASKTITWIDLQKLGEYFASQYNNGWETIDYAMHNVFGIFFYNACKSKNFKNGIEIFFPEYATKADFKEKLISERNKLFNAIKEIQQAFVEGLASNWEKDEDKELLKQYFKNRWKFPYSTPEERFTNHDDPFVFG